MTGHAVAHFRLSRLDHIRRKTSAHLKIFHLSHQVNIVNPVQFVLKMWTLSLQPAYKLVDLYPFSVAFRLRSVELCLFLLSDLHNFFHRHPHMPQRCNRPEQTLLVAGRIFIHRRSSGHY
uniref:Uncharacterized protein n=1 Tax=Peronospora matthiolae TaxID=2874970 RepID=A0AAV1T552_9STRA